MPGKVLSSPSLEKFELRPGNHLAVEEQKRVRKKEMGLRRSGNQAVWIEAFDQDSLSA